MARPVVLQDFATGVPVSSDLPGADILERRLQQAWAEGHAEGVRAGTEAAAQAHAEAQDQLRGAMVETLRDRRHDQIAAQAAVLRGIAPMVAELARALVPRLARAGLAERVEAVLGEALADRPDPRPVLRCAPDAVAGLRPATRTWAAAMILCPTRC